MTLDKRLLKRLREWSAEAKRHHEAMDALENLSDEWLLHDVVLERLMRCRADIVADIEGQDPDPARISR